MRAIWDSSSHLQCINLVASFIVLSIINISTDFFDSGVAYAPVMASENAKEPKIADIGLVLTRWLVRYPPQDLIDTRSVCTISIVRVIFIQQASQLSQSCMQLPLHFFIFKRLSRVGQAIGTTRDAAMWSVVEACIAVVSACLPIPRPVYNRVLYGKAKDNAEDIYGSYN